MESYHGVGSLDVGNEDETNTKKTYTVKYIGVVEGSMGILSRKMRMPKYTEASVYQQKEYMSQLQIQDDNSYLGHTNLPAIDNGSHFEVENDTKKHNRNKTVVGLFTKRNIVIDKPLLSTKRKYEALKYKNNASLCKPTLGDEATSTKSPVHNRSASESEDDTKTPIVQLKPTSNINGQKNKRNLDIANNSSALNLSTSGKRIRYPSSGGGMRIFTTKFRVSIYNHLLLKSF